MIKPSSPVLRTPTYMLTTKFEALDRTIVSAHTKISKNDQ